jgi:hypothetical protein
VISDSSSSCFAGKILFCASVATPFAFVLAPLGPTPRGLNRPTVERKPRLEKKEKLLPPHLVKKQYAAHLSSSTLTGENMGPLLTASLLDVLCGPPEVHKRRQEEGSTSFLLFPFPFSLNAHFILFYDLNRPEPFVRSGT